MHTLLKKREEKLKIKKEKRMNPLTEEDKQIMKKAKGRKKEASRQRSRETDEFDAIMDRYKLKVLKKIGKTQKQGPDFEEVEMSDD